MSINSLISRSIKILEHLPENKIYEVIDFIEFVSKKHEEESKLMKGIEKMANQSKSFSFLKEEEEIYDEKDLVEKY